MMQGIKIYGQIIKDEFNARIEEIKKRFRLGDLLVVSGIITRDQLRDALKRQKETGLKLGDQLIADNIISAFTLRKFLFRQQMHRVACVSAGLMMGTMSIVFSPQSTNADNFNDMIVIAKADITATDRPEYRKEQDFLFNRPQTEYSDMSAFTKWSGMLNRLEVQVKNAQNKELLNSWKDDLNEFVGLPFDEMVNSVNRYVNKTKYISDNKNWGKNDFWATPFEFFRRGGDCEDFAITKMLSLKALGVPENRMRVTIVQDLTKNIPHAVLVVYDAEGKAYVLDNQAKTVKRDSKITSYKPIFSLTRHSWWRYSS